MKRTDVNKLAKEIADRLFVNGSGEEAIRLRLELVDGRYGGGWCRQAVQYQVAEAIAKSMLGGN